MRGSYTTVAMVAVILFGGPAAAQDRAEEIDRFVRRAMEAAPVPGLSVAVVHGDEAVLVRGYGKRDLEENLPVTANTAFYIASSTKSFTALATALLAHRRALDLDAPLNRYIPELVLPAPRTAERVTLRELLTHRAGLDHDGITYRTAFSGDHDPDQLIRLLARAEATDTAFDYTNLGYVIASLVLQRSDGAPWQDVLAREVFRPLRLTRTSAYVSEAEREGWEMAVPYSSGLNSFRRWSMKADATMHAAGGLVMSAADATRWLEAQLRDGRVDGDRAFPAEVMAEAHRIQARLDATFFEFQRHAYGLGWYHALYEGDTLIHHFGSYVGFRSHISFMPQQDIGVAVFINSGSSDAFLVPDVIATYVYDLYLEKPGLEEKYAATLSQLSGRAEEWLANLRADRERRAARPDRPPHPLETYVGRYHNPDYGTVRIYVEDDRLFAEIGQIRSALEVFEGDDLRIEPVPGSGSVMRFDITHGEPAAGFIVSGDEFERVP